MMKNIGEQVIKLTNNALVKIGKSELNEASSNSIKSLIVDLSSKNLQENTVYKLLCKSIFAKSLLLGCKSNYFNDCLYFKFQDISNFCRKY